MAYDYGKAAINTIAPITMLKKNGSKKGALKGAIQGAGAGFAVGGPVGAAVGGAIGLVGGWFSEDPEEQLRQRKDAMLAQINAERTKRISAINQESANARNSNAQGAMARAIDTGRDPSNIEDSLLVANQQNVQSANKAINEADQYFADQALQVEGEYQSRPLEPSLTETLFDAGTTAIAGYYQSKGAERQDKFIDAYAKNADTAAKAIGNMGVKTGSTATNVVGVTDNLGTQSITPMYKIPELASNNDVANSINPNSVAKRDYALPRVSQFMKKRQQYNAGKVSAGLF